LSREQPSRLLRLSASTFPFSYWQMA
jgi:hypothetical protein